MRSTLLFLFFIQFYCFSQSKTIEGQWKEFDAGGSVFDGNYLSPRNHAYDLEIANGEDEIEIKCFFDTNTRAFILNDIGKEISMISDKYSKIIKTDNSKKFTIIISTVRNTSSKYKFEIVGSITSIIKSLPKIEKLENVNFGEYGSGQINSISTRNHHYSIKMEQGSYFDLEVRPKNLKKIYLKLTDPYGKSINNLTSSHSNPSIIGEVNSKDAYNLIVSSDNEYDMAEYDLLFYSNQDFKLTRKQFKQEIIKSEFKGSDIEYVISHGKGVLDIVYRSQSVLANGKVLDNYSPEEIRFGSGKIFSRITENKMSGTTLLKLTPDDLQKGEFEVGIFGDFDSLKLSDKSIENLKYDSFSKIEGSFSGGLSKNLKLICQDLKTGKIFDQKIAKDGYETFEFIIPDGKTYGFYTISDCNCLSKYQNIDLTNTKSKTIRINEINNEIVTSGIAFLLNNVFFEISKPILKPESFYQLISVAAMLKANPKMIIEIAGDSKTESTEALNNKLSLERANAVKMYLVSKGVDKLKIKTQGFGNTKPYLFENINQEYSIKDSKIRLTIVSM